jgi:hypothetical protein
MERWTQRKLGLSIIGLALFLSGVRLEHAGLRTAGIGVLAVAFVLRFVKRFAERERPDATHDESSRHDSA